MQSCGVILKDKGGSCFASNISPPVPGGHICTDKTCQLQRRSSSDPPSPELCGEKSKLLGQ